MLYLTATEKDGHLILALTDLGREELLDYASKTPCKTCGWSYADHLAKGQDKHPNACRSYYLPAEVSWSKPHATILANMLEDETANGWLEILSDVDVADLGALTSSPLIAYGVERAESYRAATATTAEILEGQLTKVDRVYWFPNYQIESELETLLRKGSVEFETGKDEPRETYTCEGCKQRFDNDKDALDHECKGAN